MKRMDQRQITRETYVNMIIIIILLLFIYWSLNIYKKN